MKIWHKILLVFSLTLLLASALAYDAFYSAPSRFTIRHETLSSIYIPEQLDGVKILYFSDLDYNNFMDEQRLAKLVRTMNELSPDVVIFGGDLFDQDARPVNPRSMSTLAGMLKQIEAPLGKFAVLGDIDERSEERLANVRTVLYDADFEVLKNQSLNLHNTGTDTVVLVGLDNSLTGYADINAAYANVSRTSYTIAICHTPDTADYVPSDLTKYFLAGHSHGGQVYWFFGSLLEPEMAEKYLRGKHTINGLYTVDVTNGVGTTIKDVRFLANAEIVLYRLEHKNIAPN